VSFRGEIYQQSGDLGAHRRHAGTKFIGTKPTDGSWGRISCGGSGKVLENFTWRNIAFFVIALLILSYVMVLGVIITVDRLLYSNWDREVDAPMVQRVKF
jgi:hypothetical protein